MLLSKDQMKALVEGMLFVSEKPVTIRQILNRLRKAEEKLKLDNEGEEVIESEENSDVSDVTEEILVDVDGAVLEVSEEHNMDLALEVESSANEDIVADENLETESPERALHQVAGGDAEVLSEEEAASDEQLDERIAQDEIMGENDHQVEEDSIAQESETDVLAQLMQKSEELEDDVSTADVKDLLAEIEQDLSAVNRGLELVKVARGYQLRTKFEVSWFLKDEKKSPLSRFSPSAMETLAIVAYQQPVNRSKVEDIRGVDSGGVLRSLMDKEFVRIVGRSDEAGRPLIYGTTNKFLEVFGLNSLKDLPSLEEFGETFSDLAAGADSQDQDIVNDDEQDSENYYLEENDIIEGDITSFQEAEQMILDELSSSMKNVKSVEQGIEVLQRKTVEENPENVVEEVAQVVAENVEGHLVEQASDSKES